MSYQLLNRLIDFLGDQHTDVLPIEKINGPTAKKVRDRTISYTEKHRGQFFKAEYDFDRISAAQGTDSYIARALNKKISRIAVAGWEFTGRNSETVDYIKERLEYMGYVSGKPYQILWFEILMDLARFSNAILVKVRDPEKSLGKPIYNSNGTQLDPVAGYFIVSMNSIKFKTSKNGEIKKILQRVPGGEEKEFSPNDVIHFYLNRNPGFAAGTPELVPVLDDVALLRRMEESIEDLVEGNLFPLFHYQVGTDEMPARYGPDGKHEVDILEEKVQYMPAGGVYISDHRHKVTTLGTEGKSLDISPYLQHAKNRVFAGLGTSGVDFGEGDSANKSTASTLSKSLLLDVEALARVFKYFIDFYVITELMLEGGFNPFDPQERVEVSFGAIDKEEKRADENQVIQSYINNLITFSEARKSLGRVPLTEEQEEDLFLRRVSEPLAMLTASAPGSAASNALAENPNSGITPEAVKKEEQFAVKMEKTRAANKAQSRGKTKTNKTNSNKTRPANQNGRRSSAKTNKDDVVSILGLDDKECFLKLEKQVSEDKIEIFISLVDARYAQLKDSGISYQSVIDTMKWRLETDE